MVWNNWYEMRTYYFIYYIKGNWEQVEVNAESISDAWKQLAKLPDNIVYIELIY